MPPIDRIVDNKHVFISYRRRGVDLYVAEKLHDALVAECGPDRIFLDTSDIPLGVDFRAHLDQRLGQSVAMLIIIGPTWLGEVDRLHQPNDMVCYEISKALEMPGLPVIPVFVDGSILPSATSLPHALAKLPDRNGIDLHQKYFDHIVEDRILPSLKPHLPARPPSVDARRGTEHLRIQQRLNELGFDPGGIDGRMGAATSKAISRFQASRNLPADGIVGPQTLAALFPENRGMDLKSVQRRLAALGFDPGAVDGAWGPDTRDAVRRFQADRGLHIDGIAGVDTLNALFPSS